MNLIGQAIRHKTMGKGIVVGMEGSSVSICFSEGVREFPYPEAFLNELELRDNDLQKEIIAEMK